MTTATLAVGDEVIFRENEEFPRVLGVVTRLWPNGRYCSLRTDGRLFVRDLQHVRKCAS